MRLIDVATSNAVGHAPSNRDRDRDDARPLHEIKYLGAYLPRAPMGVVALARDARDA